MMSSFASYNTDDATSGQAPLLAGATTVIGPFVTGVANKLAGSVYADQAGTVFIEQSFDNGQHFDISQSQSIVAGTPFTIDVDVVAPIAQIRYVNGGTNQGHMRIFARAFGNRSG